MLKAALFQCNKNREQTENLVKLAKKQGYDIDVFEDEEGQKQYGYPQVTCFAFYHVAQRMADSPFFWLEPDCSPIKGSWLRDISKEYADVAPNEDRILLPQRNGNPFDVASGIAVYPKGFHKLLPPLEHFKGTWYAFDYWVEQNLSHLIVRTNLIQHSYGVYDSDGFASHHRFPRDNDMLNKLAVLFHADKQQDLIFLNECND